MNTIIVYTDKVDNKLNNSFIENFIYNSFTMVITKNENTENAIIFDIATNHGNPNDCSCRVTMLNENTGNYETVTEFNWLNIGEEIKIKYKNKKDDDIFGDVPCDWADYLYAVMAYIMTTKRERIQKIKTEDVIVSNSEKQTREYKPKKIYLLDEIVDYVNENGLRIQQKGTRKINCPCWSVRGHYRHYKSGKRVFVRNYLKGKNRENSEPKEHKYYI